MYYNQTSVKRIFYQIFLSQSTITITIQSNPISQKILIENSRSVDTNFTISSFLSHLFGKPIVVVVEHLAGHPKITDFDCLFGIK